MPSTDFDASYNTAVGHSALFSNATGSENTALGIASLAFNPTPSTINAGLGLLTPFDIMAWPCSASQFESLCWLRPMPRTPNASPVAFPSRRRAPRKFGSNLPNTLGRSRGASRSRPSDLPKMAPSRSLPSIAARSERL